MDIEIVIQFRIELGKRVLMTKGKKKPLNSIEKAPALTHVRTCVMSLRSDCQNTACYNSKCESNKKQLYIWMLAYKRRRLKISITISTLSDSGNWSVCSSLTPLLCNTFSNEIDAIMSCLIYLFESTLYTVVSHKNAKRKWFQIRKYL